MNQTTICLLVNSGLGFRVQRTFKTWDTAHKYANKLARHVQVTELPGKYKTGDTMTGAEYCTMVKRKNKEVGR